MSGVEPMKVIFVTLRRGADRKCWRFKKIVAFLNLYKNKETVVVPNTSRVRNALEMVGSGLSRLAASNEL